MVALLAQELQPVPVHANPGHCCTREQLTCARSGIDQQQDRPGASFHMPCALWTGRSSLAITYMRWYVTIDRKSCTLFECQSELRHFSGPSDPGLQDNKDV